MPAPLQMVPAHDPRLQRISALEAEIERLRHDVYATEPRTNDALYPFVSNEQQKLTRRRKLFVQEYLVDLNASKAATRAGYRNPDVSASMLMREPAVRAGLERAIEARLSRINMRQDAAIDELVLLATSSLDHYTMDEKGNVVPTQGAPYGCMRAIQSVKRKVHEQIVKGEVVGRSYEIDIKLWDKPTSLRLLGSHLGMKFTDRDAAPADGRGAPPLVTKVIREIVDPADEDTA